MLDLYAELRRIVEALDVAGVAYALAGGLAVSIYTAPRATEDVDLLVARDDVARAVETIEALGFTGAGRPMRVAGARLEIHRLIKIAGSDLLPIDLVVPVDPNLEHLLADRASVEWEGQRVWIVGLAGLRELKRLRGSPQDRADLEALGPDAT
jgi:hypothetical protein